MLSQILRISLAVALSTAMLPTQVQAAWRPTRSSRAEAPSKPEKHHTARIKASLATTLSARPDSPTTGEPVRLSVLNALPMATDYRWKLTDDAQQPVRFPSAPNVTVQFATAGIHRVTVQITARQFMQRAALTLRIRPQPPESGPDVQRSDPPARGRSGRLKLSAVPASPSAGELVHLSVGNAPSAAAADYRWKLSQSAEHSLRLPSGPRVTVRFATPGVHRVVVQVDGQGSAQRVALSLRIRPHPHKLDPHADSRHQQGGRLAGAAPRAHAAGDPGVTISDFQFGPNTITVQVGQAITWANSGPSAHTATARDGSFDTGLLRKGASASHTFTQAGTFTYFCRIHPFMHGTVIVLPTAAAPAPSPPAGGTRAPGPPASTRTRPSASRATLPSTGINVAAGAGFGFLFLGLGLTLRRENDRSPRRRPGSDD